MPRTTPRIPNPAEAMEIARTIAADEADVFLRDKDRIIRVTNCFADDAERISRRIARAILERTGMTDDQDLGTLMNRLVRDSVDASGIDIRLPVADDLD